MGVFLAGVLEGVGGRGLDSELTAASVSTSAGRRPNQLSSAHRQGPGVDTATAGPPWAHTTPSLSQTQVFVTLFGGRPCVQTSS